MINEEERMLEKMYGREKNTPQGFTNPLYIKRKLEEALSSEVAESMQRMETDRELMLTYSKEVYKIEYALGLKKSKELIRKVVEISPRERLDQLVESQEDPDLLYSLEGRASIYDLFISILKDSNQLGDAESLGIIESKKDYLERFKRFPPLSCMDEAINSIIRLMI